MITKDLLDKIKGYDLYNNDLAPFPYEKRTITPFGLGATRFGLRVTLAALMLFAQFMQCIYFRLISDSFYIQHGFSFLFQ